MLRINNIVKTFAAHKILDNISLAMERGVLGLAGPSGSGKSTLLRCIQGLDNLDSGTIEYPGHAGFMFQDFQLFPHMNVIENLLYAPKLNKPNIDHAIKAEKFLSALGILDKKEHYPQELSGGQKQRVALARSLMMEPSYLLCDEPTSGLDILTVGDVVNVLDSVRDYGINMIIASHDLDFLTRISDRIIVLNQGKIAVDLQPNSVENPAEYLQKYY